MRCWRDRRESSVCPISFAVAASASVLHLFLCPQDTQSLQVWDCYKDAEHQFWFAEQIATTHSPIDLSETPRLTRALAALALFMAPSSPFYTVTVRLSATISLPEAKSFLGIQLAQSTICCEATQTLTTYLCSNDDERATLFDTAVQSDAVIRRASCLRSFLSNRNLSLSDQLLLWVLWRTVSSASLWPLVLYTPYFPEDEAFRSWASLVLKDIALCVRFACVLSQQLRLTFDDKFVRILVVLLMNVEGCAIEGTVVYDENAA